MKWTHYGQNAIYIDLEVDRAPDRAATTHAVARQLQADLVGSLAEEVIVGAGTIVITGITANTIAAMESSLAASLSHDSSRASVARSHEIPVVYDGADLDEVANAVSASRQDIIDWHSGREVVVELLGFLPGFAYLGDVDPRLVRPRRATPRTTVPSHSVGIAGTFTGIYPYASPGGWSLLGHAVDTVFFDADRDPPSLFAPGDRVRFMACSGEQGLHTAVHQQERKGFEAKVTLHLVSTTVGVTIQDAGRKGQLTKGLPPSGPVDWATFCKANVAVGNPKGAAAIEIPLGGIEVQAKGTVVISVDGEKVMTLHDGERFQVGSGPNAVRYLAIRGGLDVPIKLGARATLLAAKMGGLDGRILRRGDVLPVGGAHSAERLAGIHEDVEEGGDLVFVVDPGPHINRFPDHAMSVLLSTSWQISHQGNRVGVRLEGGQIPREGPDLALPVPMLRGAMQVSTDGTPIVLGPDHPVTGGYPVLAVLREAEQGRFARLRPGSDVRFRLG